MNILTKNNSLDINLTDTDHNFNPEDDSNKLRRALKGLSINQKAIIEIITNRSNQQRQEIKNVYKKLFNRNLVQDLHDSLSENVKQTIYALMLTPSELNAFIFRNALRNLSMRCLVEYFISQSNLEIIQAKIAYKHLFDSNLEEDISRNTENNFILQKFLKYLVTGITPLNEVIDLKQAQKDLHDIFGNHELWFDEVFV